MVVMMIKKLQETFTLICAVVCTISAADARQKEKAPVFPLKISQNARYLVDQNEKPFFMNGDTPWSLAVTLKQDEVVSYLEQRSRQGFNAIIINLIEHYFGGPSNAYGELPFTTPGDFSTPNEKYFAHADWIINKAAEQGMLVVLTPAYLGFLCAEQGWCQEMLASGPEKCREYGRFLGNRYKDFNNIIWMHGGDAEAGRAMNELRAIEEGIAEVDTVHLRTAHCSRQKSGLDCYDEPWLDINTTYSDCSQTPARIFDDYHRSRSMPFFYIEGTYENEGASQKCLRSQAYWTILGGGSGHFFGNNPIWFLGDGWNEALNSDGAQSMLYMRALFQSREWHKLIPDYQHELIISGYGDLNSNDYVSSAITSDGNTAISYLPSGNAVRVDLQKLSGSKIRAWWYDPATGFVNEIGDFFSDSIAAFTPPSSDDWILVLDNAGFNLPPPGTSDPISSTGHSSFSDKMDNPASFEMHQNYPNPFNAETTIFYTLPESGFVYIDVYNTAGEHIESLVNTFQSPGKYFVHFNEHQLSSGLYFYKLQVNDFIDVKKMLLLR